MLLDEWPIREPINQLKVANILYADKAWFDERHTNRYCRSCGVLITVGHVDPVFCSRCRRTKRGLR